MNSELEKEYEKALAEEPDTEKERDDEYDRTLEKILALLPDKKFVQAREILLENNEADIAELLEDVIDEEGLDTAIILFRILPKDISVDVFSFFALDTQVDVITAITDKEINYIMQELDFDDMIDVLEELPANIVDKILAKATKEERKQINTFLNYPENSAGSLMTPDYISLRKSWTVKEALEHIRDQALESETIYTCYVMDQGRKLIGIVSLRRLVTARESQLIGDLVEEDVISVGVLEDQESVSELFKKYDLLAMPVVDKENRLVGIITVDDIMDVIEEETTEDFQHMAGVVASTDEYLDMPVWKHVKSRFPWLFFLMCSYMVTGGIIARFQDSLSAVICLVAYMPMLNGTGGNSGSQAATLVIRGLATGDIELRDALRVFWKEFRIGIIVGAALSLLNFARIVWLDKNGVGVALTVALSMLAIVIIAKCVGALLPLLAKKLKIDPALMASPFIASLTDLVSTLTYFAMATKVLGI